MSRHSINIKLLENINNIDEECSEDEREFSDNEDDKEENDFDLFGNDSDTDSDQENILNIRRRQKRRIFVISSESENEEEPAKAARNISAQTSDRKTCQIRYCKKNKTNKFCLKCKKYVCGKCAIEKPIICKKCCI